MTRTANCSTEFGRLNTNVSYFNFSSMGIACGCSHVYRNWTDDDAWIRALEQSLGLPAELLRYAGFSLLPFAAFLLFLAARQQSSRHAVWAAILLNVLWTIR